jgi:O-antigen/teichoic acid export membrane protein
MIKNALTITITRLIAAFITLLLVLATARIYGATGRGEISLLILGITLITIVAGVVAGSSLVYLLNKVNVRNAYILSLAWIVISSVCTGFIIIQLHLIAPEFYVWIMILGALQAVFQAHQYFVLASNSIKAFNYSTVLQSGSMVVFFIVLEYINPHQITNYAIAQLSSCVVGILPTLPYLFNIKQTTLQLNEELKHTGYTIIKTGIITQTANIVQLLSYRLNFYVIKDQIDVATVGIYSISIMITDTILIISKSMGTSMYASVASNESSNTSQLTMRNIQLSLLLTALAYVLVALVPQVLIINLFSVEFIPVKEWCLLSAFSALLFTCTVGISNYFSGNGAFTINTKGSVIAAISIVLLSWPCVHYFNVYGAILSTTLATITQLVYMWYMFKKQNASVTITQLLPTAVVLKQVINQVKNRF